MSIQVTGSYLQDKRHSNVSQKFNVIQPLWVGNIMASHGLHLASLSTGRARHEDKKDHQKTYSRYRGEEILPGIYIDIIHCCFHMGRGRDSFSVGFYRTICTNGCQTGTSFERFDVRHSGDTWIQLNSAIEGCLKAKEQLKQAILKMQTTVLTEEQRIEFGKQVAALLTPRNALKVKHRLLNPQRVEDNGYGLFEVMQVSQERGVQGNNLVYIIPSKDAQGHETTRQMTARGIKPNSQKSDDFNSQLFELAMKFAA
jgi:hypothetical protein